MALVWNPFEVGLVSVWVGSVQDCFFVDLKLVGCSLDMVRDQFGIGLGSVQGSV